MYLQADKGENLNLYNTTNKRIVEWVCCLILLAISGCTWSSEQVSCPKTTREFVDYFNSRNFRGAASLFQKNALNTRQFKRMSKNLNYVYGVAGGISSTEFVEQRGSKILLKSFHENTVMDLIFEVNDRCQLESYIIKIHYPDSLQQLDRNQTPLILPFNEQWYVKWGGPTISQNYHNRYRNMRGAFDFIRKDEQGNSHQNNGQKNEDYYAFGQEILAPCEATVLVVVDGIEDNPVGDPNTLYTYGNAVILGTDNDEYILLGHLKHKSILVKEGQKVKQGDPLALCGNSGYSDEPHLHFIVQNAPDLFHPTGAKCHFDSILVNGRVMQDYSPVQGELVSNEKP